MKTLIISFLFFVFTSFIVKDVNLNDNTNYKTEPNDSLISISVRKINYTRNIDSVVYNKEIRETNTEYFIDLKNNTLNVNFSDGSSVFIDSIKVVKNINSYEVYFFDNDLMGNVPSIYTKIKIDPVLNKVDYIERNLEYNNDYNRYEFLDFKMDIK
jgi:hypothetical protein